MSWTITVGIDKFMLTDQEKDFYLHAVSSGEKHIQVKKGLFIGANYQSLVQNNTENPILNNPNWIELQQLKGKSDDEAIRRKMKLEHAINVQFPYERYVNEWEEAKHSQSKQIVKGGEYYG